MPSNRLQTTSCCRELALTANHAACIASAFQVRAKIPSRFHPSSLLGQKDSPPSAQFLLAAQGPKPESRAATVCPGPGPAHGPPPAGAETAQQPRSRGFHGRKAVSPLKPRPSGRGGSAPVVVPVSAHQPRLGTTTGLYTAGILGDRKACGYVTSPVALRTRGLLRDTQREWQARRRSHGLICATPGPALRASQGVQ
jgi:hypothetical protein